MIFSTLGEKIKWGSFCVFFHQFFLQIIQINLWTFSIYFRSFISACIDVELIWARTAPLRLSLALSHRKLKELTLSKCTFFTLLVAYSINGSFFSSKMRSGDWTDDLSQTITNNSRCLSKWVLIYIGLTFILR